MFSSSFFAGIPGPRYKTEHALLRRKIFVGGIGPLGEKDISAFFSKHGEIESVEVLRGRDKQPRGFSFIIFKKAETVDKLVSTRFFELGNRAVEVTALSHAPAAAIQPLICFCCFVFGAVLCRSRPASRSSGRRLASTGLPPKHLRAAHIRVRGKVRPRATRCHRARLRRHSWAHLLEHHNRSPMIALCSSHDRQIPCRLQVHSLADGNTTSSCSRQVINENTGWSSNRCNNSSHRCSSSNSSHSSHSSLALHQLGLGAVCTYNMCWVRKRDKASAATSRRDL